jgi:plasmid maintenance system antidote protein VapI
MSKSSITTRRAGRKGVAVPRRITVRPGEVPSEEFLNPLGLSANALTLALWVPAARRRAIPQARTELV